MCRDIEMEIVQARALEKELAQMRLALADIEDEFREYIDCMPEGIFKEMAERKFYSAYPEWRDTFIAEFLVDDGVEQ